jgi:hypothetical protein
MSDNNNINNNNINTLLKFLFNDVLTQQLIGQLQT